MHHHDITGDPLCWRNVPSPQCNGAACLFEHTSPVGRWLVPLYLTNALIYGLTAGDLYSWDFLQCTSATRLARLQPALNTIIHFLAPADVTEPHLFTKQHLKPSFNTLLLSCIVFSMNRPIVSARYQIIAKVLIEIKKFLLV